MANQSVNKESGVPTWAKAKPAGTHEGRPGQPGAGTQHTFESGRREFMEALGDHPAGNVRPNKPTKGRKSTKEAYD